MRAAFPTVIHRPDGCEVHVQLSDVGWELVVSHGSARKTLTVDKADVRKYWDGSHAEPQDLAVAVDKIAAELKTSAATNARHDAASR